MIELRAQGQISSRDGSPCEEGSARFQVTAQEFAFLVQLGLQLLLSAALRFQEFHKGGKDL